MSSLMRRVVAITGASSGIGAASAVEFAKHSARLVLHGRNEEALADVRQRCVNSGIQDHDVVTVVGDLHEEETIDKIVTTARKHFGAIHVLFNNAGYVHPKDGPIHMGGQIEAMDAMYHITVRVPYLLVQKCLEDLEKNQGVVINCSSGLSRAVDPRMTGYSCAKAAMDHLTKNMALALGMRGIRVNALNPGFVPTKIFRPFGEEYMNTAMDAVALGSPFKQQLATPEDIAKVVVFLASDNSAALTGETVICDLLAASTNPVVDFTQFK